MNNKKTKRNQEIFKFVYASALIAIIVILTATVGYIPFFGGIKITILHIPVILGAIVLGKRYGLLLGFVFGAGAMIRSFIEVIPENVPFTNRFYPSCRGCFSVTSPPCCTTRFGKFSNARRCP